MEKKVSILLAEDDVNLGSLLKQYLDAKGYSTDLFNDGEKATTGFRSGSYDICILDIMMPKKDGFAVATEIREINTTIPIIFLTAKNLKEGQKGLLLAATFKLFGPLYLIIPGIVAFHIFQDNPLPIGDMAYPKLVTTVLPFYLTGFFAAVLFGAILSSFNAALNSTSTLFMLNIYKPYIKPDASDKQVVFAGKVVAIVLACFSMCVAPLIAKAPSGVFNYLQMVNGFYNVPIFTLIIFGMLNKKAPAWSAKVTLIAFIIAYGLTQIPFAGKEAIPVLGWLSSVHYLHVMAILFVIAVTFMYLTGKFAPATNTYDDSKDLHVVDTTPWNKGVVMSVAIVLCVFAVYVIFSKFGIAA